MKYSIMCTVIEPAHQNKGRGIFMKKLFAILLLFCLLFTLAACGKPFVCEACDKEKTGKQHTITLFGESGTVCDDCSKEFRAAMKEFGIDY